MTEGSAQEDEEGNKGPDFSASGRLPQRGMPQQGPTWPSQNTDEPSQSQIDTHDHLPQTGSEETDAAGRPVSPLASPKGGYPQLQLPSKPKAGRPNLDINRYPNADDQSQGGQPMQPGYAQGGQPMQPGYAHGGQPMQPGYAHGGQPSQPGVAGGPADAGMPGGSAPVWPGAAPAKPTWPGQGGASARDQHNAASSYQASYQPGQASHQPGQASHQPGQASHQPGQASHQPGQASHQPGQASHQPGQASHQPGQASHQSGQASHQPGQINPNFIPPTEAPALPNAGYVPINTGSAQSPSPPHKTPKPGAPIITSTSAKPNWTQPQWPGGNPKTSPQKTGFGPVLARRATGNRLPPTLLPQPQAPYSQAPPTSANESSGLFGGPMAPTQYPNAIDPNFAGQTAPLQVLKNSLPFTIQRDLILAKQLFGDKANRPAQKERREYKQTEYIPKAPVLKVSAPDPDRPWKAVPAATYEFFAEEEKAPAKPQSGINNAQNRKEPQVPRAFNPENPRVVEDLDSQPDPRYSPYQGELIKDISIQDKKAGYAEEPIPEETRARGTAALRALGRNSDHYYENHPGTNPQSEDLPKSVRLTSRDLFGLATYYVIVTKEVLTSPQSFFANMSLVGGLNDPLLYLAFASVMGGLLSAIAKLNPLLFFLAAIFSLVSVAFEAVLLQFVLKRMGGEGKFEQTFNVLAYSKATFIFAWICLGPWPVGAILATLYTAYLNYLGLSRAHRMPAASMWTVIGIMTAIGIIIKFVMK